MKLVFLQGLLIIRCIICELLGFLVEFSYHYRISKEICIVLLVSITVSDNTLIEVFHLILGFSLDYAGYLSDIFAVQKQSTFAFQAGQSSSLNHALFCCTPPLLLISPTGF